MEGGVSCSVGGYTRFQCLCNIEGNDDGRRRRWTGIADMV